MDITKLNPWNWFKKEDSEQAALPVRRDTDKNGQALHPLFALHSEMDRLFDRAFSGLGLRSPLLGGAFPANPGQGAFKPTLDIAGSKKEYTITAELPGMDQKDIAIELQGDTLIITGEKQQEAKSEDKGWYRVERSYGSFRRVLDLPQDADRDNIKASHNKGVLTITLPRTKAVAAEAKRIALS